MCADSSGSIAQLSQLLGLKGLSVSLLLLLEGLGFRGLGLLKGLGV